jgi:hypothetical protein
MICLLSLIANVITFYLLEATLEAFDFVITGRTNWSFFLSGIYQYRVVCTRICCCSVLQVDRLGLYGWITKRRH